MFNFSWSEILVIGAIALIVIGPKDLPRALRTAGIFMRRMRGFAREFQGSIDQMVREADLEEAERTFRKSLAEVDLPDLSLDHPAIAKAVEPPPSILAPGPAMAGSVEEAASLFHEAPEPVPAQPLAHDAPAHAAAPNHPPEP